MGVKYMLFSVHVYLNDRSITAKPVREDKRWDQSDHQRRVALPSKMATVTRSFTTVPNV